MLLVKKLIRAKQAKNEQLVNDINDKLIGLRNAIIKNEIPENENPNKIVDIIEKMLDFNKAKGRPSDLTTCIKLLTSTQMLQRLPIALAQVKAGNTSENILNGIRQIIYFLYREKEVTKKVYDNIMNSIKL